MNTQASRDSKPKVTSTVVRISGSEPGALDPTQRSRLLRTSNSTLSFASFDPYIAATNDVNLAKLSLDGDSCRPKRIVIETIPGQGSFWRWVPSARKMQDVDDEGVFPRIINICGAYVECSQDQWDIYKLDPQYDCFVKFPPALTVISLKDLTQDGSPEKSKQHAATTPSIPDDESDLEKMIVDDDSTPFNPDPPKRKSRGVRLSSPRVPHHFDFSVPPPTPENPRTNKRAHVAFQGLRPTEEEENEYFQEDSVHRNTRYYTPKFQKRARTLSPGSKKRNLNAHKTSRMSAKQEKWDKEKQDRREQRERRFMRDILSDLPPAQANANVNGSSQFADIPEENEADMADDTIPITEDSSNSIPEQATEEEEAAHRLAESVRKMQELNADRARQRAREMRGRGEPTTSRAKSEDPGAARRKKDKLEAEKKREQAQAEQEERIRVRKEEEARRTQRENLEQFIRERKTRHRHWDDGLWNAARAVERYKAISAFFDKARFKKDEYPLTGIDIPWPTMRHPHVSTARDMDWESVTYFFNVIKAGLRSQEFNDLVKTSLQRFHPDRWRSRNLYLAIADENERNEVETAVSTVSKAIGSLWAELKSSSEV